MAAKMYNVFHCYDTDGGFGDAVSQTELVGTVWANDAEIAEFIEKWNKPQVYDRPYADLYFGTVYAEEVKVVPLSDVTPYNSKNFLGIEDFVEAE